MLSYSPVSHSVRGVRGPAAVRSDARLRRATRNLANTAFVPLETLEHRTLLAGQLDPSFGGGDGVVAHPEAGINIFPVALAAAPDGKLVAAGDDDNPAASFDFFAARYNADGSLDTTFGAGGYQSADFDGGSDRTVDVAVQPDGKVVVAGTTGPAPGTATRPGGIALARFNADGSPDPTFDGDGKAVVAVPAAVGNETIDFALAPGGKFLVLGRGIVVRLNPDGSPDATFDGDGVAEIRYQGTAAPGTALGVAPDGKVLVAGVGPFDPNPPGASGDLVVTRLTEGGAPDATFSGDGTSVFHHPEPDVTAYPDDIVVTGGKAVVSYGSGAGVTRVNDDGTLDTTFGDGGFRTVGAPYTSDVAGLTVLPDGRLVLGISGFDQNHRAARLTPDGDPDPTFGGGDGIGEMPVTTQFGGLLDTVVQPSGRVVGLAWSFADSSAAFGLAALTPDGLHDASFPAETPSADPVTRFGRFDDVVELADGKLLAVGAVTEDSVTPAPYTPPTGGYLARLNADGSFDTTFGGGDGKVIVEGTANAFRRLALQPDGKILAFGSALARFNPDGTLDNTFGGGDGLVTPFAPGAGLALQPDGRILTAEGTDGSTHGHHPASDAFVARYLADGSVDASFGEAGRVVFDDPIGRAPWNEGGPYDGFVPLDVAWQAASGRIVVGGQTPGFGTTTDFAAVRLLPTGQLDTSFANGLGMVTHDTGDIDFGGRIDVAPDGRIAMAGEEEDEDPTAVLFDNNGNWARARRLPWVGDTSDVSFTPDGKIVVVGGAEGYDPDTELENFDVHVVRLDGDLAGFTLPEYVDDSFGGGDGVRTDVFGSSDDYPLGVAVGADGDVIAAGISDEAAVLLRYDGGGLAAPAVARTFFGSSTWSPSFLRALDRGDGDDRYGFGVAAPAQGALTPAGEVQAPLPWINLDTVSVQFNRPVGVDRGDLRIGGVNVAEYGVKDFRYDANTRTAVWTLDRPLEAEKLLLQLDGVEGVAAFRSRVDVLPGDTTADRRVLAEDYAEVKKRFFASADNPAASSSPYDVRFDVDGSGVVLAADYAEVKKRFFTQLPAGEPTGAGGGAGSGTSSSSSATREMFGQTAIFA